MRVTTLFAFFVLFFLGWALNDIFENVGEQPSPLTGFVTTFGDQSSPSDVVPEEHIHVYSDRVVIELDDPEWARFTDTNSMDPVFDKGANAIQIKPTSPDQIEVGDIISFTTPLKSGTIIHRVVEIGEDEDGWYAKTKGDNNPYGDPGKRRFHEVKKLLVGIIY